MGELTSEEQKAWERGIESGFVNISPESPNEDVRAAFVRLNASRERLEWALNFAQENVGALSRGRLSDLGIELLVFQYLAGADFGDATATAYQYDAVPPNGSELLHYQNEFARIFEKLVQEGHVYIGDFKLRMWVNKQRPSRYMMMKSSDLAVFELGILLGDYAGDIKVCPAPKLRTRTDEQCGRWFVGRSNQVYCSSSCQSRAATRMARRKQQRVPKKRGRPRKES